jgi:hypothetical protein
LQKTVLVLGLEKGDEGALLYPEILARYYGWEPVARFTYRGRIGEHTFPYLDRIGEHTFSMGEIGEKEYRSARAALSRSVARLAERGLVIFVVHVIIDKIRGVYLTDLGKEEARKLSANTRLNSGKY